MSFVAVFTALMSGFVLIAPVAMVALLVRGPARVRRTVPALALPGACPCGTAACSCVAAREPQLARAA